MSRPIAVRTARWLRSLRTDWAALDRRTAQAEEAARENVDLSRLLGRRVDTLERQVLDLADRRLHQRSAATKEDR